MLGTNIHLAKTASLVLSQAHDFTRSVSEFIKHVLKPLKTILIWIGMYPKGNVHNHKKPVPVKVQVPALIDVTIV